MKNIRVKTDLHCNSCVNKLKPHLESAGINEWKVDLASPGKELIIYQDVSRKKIAGILSTAGFNALEEEAATFWKDLSTWKKAASNTFNCLIGCSIGDFGMIIVLQNWYPGTSMLTQMVLASIAGLFTSILLETIILRTREKFSWVQSVKTALGMSFFSMLAMEIVMNLTDFMITGGSMETGDIFFWLSFIPAALAGFMAPLPYNYLQLKKYNRACH